MALPILVQESDVDRNVVIGRWTFPELLLNPKVIQPLPPSEILRIDRVYFECAESWRIDLILEKIAHVYSCAAAQHGFKVIRPHVAQVEGVQYRLHAHLE